MKQLSAYQLTTNRDLQELIEKAVEAGWVVQKTGSGHIKWVPPRGGIVHTASTPSDYRALNNIRSELKRRGLDVSKHEEPKVATESYIQVRAPAPDPEPPPPAPIVAQSAPPAPRRQGVKEEIYRVIHEAGPKGLSIELLVERLQPKFPGIQAKDTYTTLGVGTTQGQFRRIGQGVYAWASTEGPAVVERPKPNLPEEAGQVEDVLERFFTAFVELEQWVRRMNKRSQHFEKLKKLLEGQDIE